MEDIEDMEDIFTEIVTGIISYLCFCFDTSSVIVGHIDLPLLPDSVGRPPWPAG